MSAICYAIAGYILFGAYFISAVTRDYGIEVTVQGHRMVFRLNIHARIHVLAVIKRVVAWPKTFVELIKLILKKVDEEEEETIKELEYILKKIEEDEKKAE